MQIYDGPINIQNCTFRKFIALDGRHTSAFGFRLNNSWQSCPNNNVTDITFDDVPVSDVCFHPDLCALCDPVTALFVLLNNSGWGHCLRAIPGTLIDFVQDVKEDYNILERLLADRGCPSSGYNHLSPTLLSLPIVRDEALLAARSRAEIWLGLCGSAQCATVEILWTLFMRKNCIYTCYK